MNGGPDVFTAGRPRTLRDARRRPERAPPEHPRHPENDRRRDPDLATARSSRRCLPSRRRRPASGDHEPGLLRQELRPGRIGSDADAQQKEELEDRYFSGNPDGLQYENHESVNSVRVGAERLRRASGSTPAASATARACRRRSASSRQRTTTTRSSGRPPSHGRTAMSACGGCRTYAMSQHNVASLQPPHLKAMIALGTDSDLYNEYLYGGGLFGEGFWTWWREALTRAQLVRRAPRDRLDGAPASHPVQRPGRVRPDGHHLHVPGAREGDRAGLDRRPADRRRSSTSWAAARPTSGPTGAQARRFDFVDAWFPHSYEHSTVAEHLRFFDHWLKGIDNGIMDGAPVRVQVRTGNAATIRLEEAEWPIARTDYPPVLPRRHGIGLDRRRARRADFLRISPTSRPVKRRQATTPTSICGIADTRADRLRRRHAALVDRHLVRQRPDDRGHGARRLHEGRALGVVDEHRHGRLRLAARDR